MAARWVSLPGGHCLLGRDTCAEAGLRGTAGAPGNPSTRQALLQFTEGGVVPWRKGHSSLPSSFHIEPCEALSPHIQGARESPKDKGLQTDSCGFSLPASSQEQHHGLRAGSVPCILMVGPQMSLHSSLFLDPSADGSLCFLPTYSRQCREQGVHMY